MSAVAALVFASGLFPSASLNRYDAWSWGYMRRRDFNTFFVGAVAVWPFAIRAQRPDRMQYVGALKEAKRDYEKISHPNEAARSDYITRLVRMREKAVRPRTDEWQAIDTEINRHPAPNNSHSKIFSSLLRR